MFPSHKVITIITSPQLLPLCLQWSTEKSFYFYVWLQVQAHSDYDHCILKKKPQHYLNACMVWLSCGFKVVIYICDLTPNEKCSILTCIYRNKYSKSGSMTQFWKLFLCSHLSCYDLNICLNLSVQMHFNLFKN